MKDSFYELDVKATHNDSPQTDYEDDYLRSLVNLGSVVLVKNKQLLVVENI